MLQHKSIRRFVVLLGVRRVGKNVESVLAICEMLYPIEGTRYIFFDEIQYTDNWELWMKVIYDSRKDIRLIATGSASCCGRTAQAENTLRGKIPK